MGQATALSRSLARLSPWAVAALVLALASAFVVARWAVAAERDTSRFVVAGSEWVDEDAGIAVQPGNGYDGQFSYRLARDPTELERTAYGVTLDAPLRLQRITYPALAHLAAVGRPALVPAALVVVNVLGLGLLALLSALLAREAGRPPVAGLLVVGATGFVTTLSRDLTEIVTVLLLVGGVAAWQRARPGPAVLLFAAAVLSRESALLLYAAFAAAELPRATWRTRVLGLLPPAAFVVWQGVCAAVTGDVPLLSSSGKNLVLPLQDLAPAAAGWVRGAAALDRADLLTTLQLAALTVLVVAAALSLRSTRAALGVRAAWAVALLLVISLSANVWIGPAELRTAAELHALSALVLLRSRAPLVLPAAAVGLAVAVTALFRVTSL